MDLGAFSNLTGPVISRTLWANSLSCRNINALFPEVTPEQVTPMAMFSRPFSFSQQESFSPSWCQPCCLCQLTLCQHLLFCAILTFSSRRCGSPSVQGSGSALRSFSLNHWVPCMKFFLSCCLKIRAALPCAATSPGQPAGSSGGFLDSINILLMK